jgi:CheY-like chemotaxis protein
VNCAADVPMNLKLLRNVLVRQGFAADKMQSAADGALALEAVQQSVATATAPFGIVFIDNSMPVMVCSWNSSWPFWLIVFSNPSLTCLPVTLPQQTGVEATRQMRARGFNQLIVAVSGNSMAEEVVEFLDAGADLMLIKPVRSEVIQLVVDYVRQHGTGQMRRGWKLCLTGKSLSLMRAEDCFASVTNLQLKIN